MECKPGEVGNSRRPKLRQMDGVVRTCASLLLKEVEWSLEGSHGSNTVIVLKMIHLFLLYLHTHTHTHIYIYIYIIYPPVSFKNWESYLQGKVLALIA